MDLLSEFKEFLQANLPKAKSFHPYYERALAQMLLAGGKHFRAQLLLGAVDALKPRLVNAAMRVALGVEMLHAYSLIHDDLPAMDNSDLRRGEPTLHVAYDEVTAILVGDALNTQAFLEISRAELPADTRIKCVEILAQNAGASGMVLGQALDCFFETSQKARALRARFAVSERALNLEELTFLHLHKTGKLIAASLQMGSVIAGLSDEKCERIYKIGLDLGLAFQIGVAFVEIELPGHLEGVDFAECDIAAHVLQADFLVGGQVPVVFQQQGFGFGVAVEHFHPGVVDLGHIGHEGGGVFTVEIAAALVVAFLQVVYRIIQVAFRPLGAGKVVAFVAVAVGGQAV